MPNQLSLIPPGLNQITHDPTKTLNGNPMGFLGDDPYGEMTEEIVFGAINSFLEMLYDVTKIDLRPYAEVLEGIPFDLLSTVLQGQGNWTSLLSGTGVPNVEGLISLILNPIAAIQSFIPDFIPVSSIVDAALNLLPDGLFGSSGSILSGGPWSWTNLVSSGSALGSGNVAHDGSLIELFSDPPTKVQAGQNVTATQDVSWQGIGSTVGSAFTLGLQLFDAAMLPLGDPITLADIANPLSDSASEPDANADGFVPLGGGFTIPAGVSYISQYLAVNPVVSQGQSWWSNSSLSRNALLPQSLVANLPAQITDLFNQAQAQLDTLVQAMIGGNLTGYLLPDLKAAMQQIPGFNVLGAAGIPTMDETVTSMWDSVTSALRQLGGLSGVSLADFASAAQDTSQSASVAEQLAIIQQNILGNRTNNPIEGALERTTITNIGMKELGTGATPLNIPVTQAASAIGMIRMPNADTKGASYFRSIMSGTVTGFYLNFGKMALDGSVTPLFSSGNLASSLSTTWRWLAYTFPGVNKIAHNASENLVVEYQVIGSGTVNVMGLPMSWQTDDHPVATTKRTGATRNTGASGPVALSIPAGSVQFSGSTPQVSLGRSDVPVNYVPPDLQRFNASGTYVRPTWMVAGDILEIYIHPAGGGGQSGGYGVSGEGGLGGTPVGQSYVLGSDPKGTGFPIIPLSTTTFTHTLGAPGNGGFDPYTLDPGFNAGATSVSAAGITTLTGAGGIGGGRAGNNSSVATGGGSANVTLDGHTEYGGTPAGVNQAGVFPGGGGGSGYPAFGQPGAAAQVAYRARQGS